MSFDIPTDWTFKNASVAAGFERHVREQLPFYELVSGAVAHIARHYLPEGGRLYDIGASTGNITRLLSDSLKSRNIEAISLDNSPDMANLFDGYGRYELTDVLDYPIRTLRRRDALPRPNVPTRLETKAVPSAPLRKPKRRRRFNRRR
jgi:tRNA (cmo5U34)-methyltransferase